MTEKDELFFQSVVDAYHACHESLRDTAKAMQLSRTKVRKILITMGALESDITERALALREKGYGRDEIADELGVSAATLSTYMPYGERVYNRINIGARPREDMGISWINTESCMPLWGSDEQSVGNNPFCIAVPRKDEPIVVDMAMSQYAYGKLGVYRLAGKSLPYPGGFDKEGNLTSDPGAIEESRRILPTGYWKGSGLALALDLAATLMANGKSGSDMDADGLGSCGGCSQIFIAYDPNMFGEQEEIMEKLDRRVTAARNAHPIDSARPVTCPGDQTRKRRAKSMKEGIHVDDGIWRQIIELASN